MATLTVPARFNGPHESGNGGYTAGVEHVVIAWPLASDGRKSSAAAAILDTAGTVLASGEALLVEPRAS